MEEDGDSAKFPQRPKLGPQPVPKDPPHEESYGSAYYSANTSMQESAPPPVRSVSKSSGGWLTILIIGGTATYLYFHPGTVSSAIAATERWVTSLRGNVYEEGKGYGDIPEAERFETKR